VFGSEYSWGTLRLQLARQPQRGQYLVAKTVALLLFLLLGIGLAMLCGSLLGLFFGAVLGNSGQVSASDLLLLPWRMLRSLYVMLPYVMFTVACCVLGRSVLAGAVGGFLFLAADISVGAFSFLTSMSDTLAFIYNLLVVQQNINTLVVLNSQSYGLNPAIITRNLDLAALPSPFQAVLVIAVYSGSFFAVAYRLFVRRDLTGAS
jgi:ABC-type transport system involved in multi-copper enzyme maturation permease subunit